MQTLGQFPMVRMRRNRHDSFSRRLVRETTLSPNDLILPVFVQEGEHRRDQMCIRDRLNSLLKLF